MKSAALFVSLIAACSIGCIASASARSGGGGAAAGSHGGMRAGGHAFFRGLRPTFGHAIAAKRAFRGIDLRRRRITGLPYWPSAGDFDPFYYYPPADPTVTEGSAATYAGMPVAPSQQPPNRVLVAPPGCRTQEQKVQSEAGGEQVVHITRCY